MSGHTCASCGAALAPGAVFCPTCGARSGAAPAVGAAPAAPVPAAPLPPAPAPPAPDHAAPTFDDPAPTFVAPTFPGPGASFDEPTRVDAPVAPPSDATTVLPVPPPVPPAGPPIGGSQLPPRSGRPPRRPSSGPDRRLLIGLLLAALVVAAIPVLLMLKGSGSSDEDGDAGADTTASIDAPTTTAERQRATTTSTTEALPAPASNPRISRARASSTAPDGVDASGGAVSYAAGNLLDGYSDTAWRVAGDGIGTTITLQLSERSTIHRVGILPGYDKVDASSGDDRWTQNRRPTLVEWAFDDGTTITRSLEDARTFQWFDVEAVSSTVTITFLDSTALPERDFLAVSELDVQ